MIQKSCVGFTEVLSSKAPTPGGGAAALVGAFGTALCSMVGNLTVGRKRYASVEENVKIMLAKAEKLQLRLLQLVDEDAAAFEPLAKAYSMPKDDPAYLETMESITASACQAPLEMMKACCQAIDLLEEMMDKGSVTLVSDVGCGALCCKAALESASLNIFVNTRSLKDRGKAAELESEADQMLAAYGPKAEQIANEVTRRLRGGV